MSFGFTIYYNIVLEEEVMFKTIIAIAKSKYIEKWYWGFLLQGAIVLGLAPILIPIIVGSQKGALEAGAVVGAFYLGQLASPVFGMLADKYSLYKFLYLASYIFMGMSVVGFIYVDSVALWFILALIIGLSAGAGNTISAMYIVEVKPHQEWDQRIGWLQTFYGTGQALGLFAAAAFATNASWGMMFAGALMLPGFLLSRRTVPYIGSTSRSKAVPRIHHHISRRSKSIIPPFHHYQNVTLRSIKKFIRNIYTPFGLFLLSWFLVTLGMWMFMNLYPLLMSKSYGISEGESSTYYAIFATAGAFAYAPSGRLGKIIGNSVVVFIGVIMLFASLLGLGILCFCGRSEWGVLVPIAFAMIPIAWSPLIVAGTSFASELTPFGQGEGLGLFNASTALSSVIAAFLAGIIAHTWDYPTLIICAMIVVFLGAIFFMPLLKRHS